ncbi:MAG: sporulation transcriptional regulator SpoIIID [Clostridia bacterium]|nr:sporulation transcriptional regulator SpoIIID [Clostridia bacterium]
MIDSVEARAVELGEYIVKNRATVRMTADVFSVSKSTVHIDVTKRLRNIDSSLYLKVREILDVNKAQRHIRGGMATKEKYKNLNMGKENV